MDLKKLLSGKKSFPIEAYSETLVNSSANVWFNSRKELPGKDITLYLHFVMAVRVKEPIGDWSLVAPGENRYRYKDSAVMLNLSKYTNVSDLVMEIATVELTGQRVDRDTIRNVKVNIWQFFNGLREQYGDPTLAPTMEELKARSL